MNTTTREDLAARRASMDNDQMNLAARKVRTRLSMLLSDLAAMGSGAAVSRVKAAIKSTSALDALEAFDEAMIDGGTMEAAIREAATRGGAHESDIEATAQALRAERMSI